MGVKAPWGKFAYGENSSMNPFCSLPDDCLWGAVVLQRRPGEVPYEERVALCSVLKLRPVGQPPPNALLFFLSCFTSPLPSLLLLCSCTSPPPPRCWNTLLTVSKQTKSYSLHLPAPRTQKKELKQRQYKLLHIQNFNPICKSSWEDFTVKQK